MFDTMTLTKIASGLLGAWLILLLGKWAGEEIYHAEAHGAQSYVIEVEDGGGSDEPAEVIDIAALVAVADPEDGARVFRKCSACHKVDGTDGVGPHLDGVVGRAKASIVGFGYSGPLAAMEGDWTVENLSDFLEKPSDYVPGTTMSFAGLSKADERAELIAYLQSVGG